MIIGMKFGIREVWNVMLYKEEDVKQKTFNETNLWKLGAPLHSKHCCWLNI